MDGRKVWKALAVAMGLLVSLPAAAQMAQDSPHFYGGGKVGRNDHGEMAWGAFGGYQLNRWLAAEFGYQDLGEQTIGGNTIDEASAWEVLGVGRFPIIDRLAAYGKLGAYRGRTKGGGFNERNTDLTYGLGVEYDFTRNIAVRGEWQRYWDLGGGGSGTADLDVLSVGVVYRFR